MGDWVISFSTWQSLEVHALSRHWPTNLFTKKSVVAGKKELKKLRAYASIPAGSEDSWVLPGQETESSTLWLSSFNLRNRMSTGYCYYFNVLSVCSNL